MRSAGAAEESAVFVDSRSSGGMLSSATALPSGLPGKSLTHVGTAPRLTRRQGNSHPSTNGFPTPWISATRSSHRTVRRGWRSRVRIRDGSSRYSLLGRDPPPAPNNAPPAYRATVCPGSPWRGLRADPLRRRRRSCAVAWRTPRGSRARRRVRDGACPRRIVARARRADVLQHTARCHG